MSIAREVHFVARSVCEKATGAAPKGSNLCALQKRGAVLTLSQMIEEVPGHPVSQVLQHYLREYYTYDELLADPLPPGIDATKLEVWCRFFFFYINKKERERL